MRTTGCSRITGATTVMVGDTPRDSRLLVFVRAQSLPWSCSQDRMYAATDLGGRFGQSRVRSSTDTIGGLTLAESWCDDVVLQDSC